MKTREKTVLAAALSAFTLCLSALAGPAVAHGNVDPAGQDVHTPPPGFDLPASGHVHGPDTPWCGTDMSSPQTMKIIEQVRQDRKAGRYPISRKGRLDPEIGDRQTFNVSETGVASYEFELIDKTSLYHLWVEVGELANGNVDQGKANQLRSSVLESTPTRSINPSKGTFANNHDIFGLPPDVDGDGIVDILMYDIGQGSGSTLGYFWPADQLVDSSSGNGRDILYLDSNEGTRNFSTLAVIAAHEYAHLIHFAYGSDQTFISEGLAEYAMVMNGFYWRGVSFASSVTEVSLPLFTWRSDQGSVGARGYERGGLFFTYIGEQMGPETVGKMMRMEKKGATGIDSILALDGSSLLEVILDYHTANRVNDRSIDPRFGYREPERSFHRTPLMSPPVNGEVQSSSGEGGYTLQFDEKINGGSVHYFQLTRAADVSVTYDTPDPTGLFYDLKVLRHRARALLEEADGTVRWVDLDPSKNTVVLEGAYDTVTFIFAHGDPQIPGAERSTMFASWTPLSMATSVDEARTLPRGLALESVYPNPFQDHASASIRLDRAAPVQLVLIDMVGRERLRRDLGTLNGGIHTVDFDARGLEAGAYLMRISTGDGTDSRLITIAQ